MIYTQDDLTAVKTAIIELSIGKRVVRISFSHGETVEYGPVSLKDLKTLYSEILTDLELSENGAQPIKSITSKGL